MVHPWWRNPLLVCAGATLLGACAAGSGENNSQSARSRLGTAASGITIGGPSVCIAPQIKSKSWRVPVRLGTDVGQIFLPPEVATSANGEAMVVWLEYAASNTYNVRANRYAAPAGRVFPSWQATPDVVGTYVYDAFGNYSEMPPALAMDDSGGAVVVWPEYVGTTSYNIQARRFTPAAGWGAVTLLGSSAFNYPPMVDVAMDGSGHAIAVWEVHDLPSSIYYARYTPTGGWGSATALENSGGDARFPNIAASSNGTMVVVWQQMDVEHSVYARQFVPATGWGAITRIDSAFDGLHAHHPRVAMNANGQAAVSWIADHGNNNVDVYSNVVDAAGGWGTARILSANVIGDWGTDHAVAIDNMGNAVTVWNGEEAGQLNVYARRVLPGGSLDAATRILDLRNDPATHPDIDMDANGNAIVVWLQIDGTSKSIYARHLTHRLPTPGCPEAWSWGTVHIEQAANRIFQIPRIAMYARGNAVAVWKTFDAAGTESVYAAVYQ